MQGYTGFDLDFSLTQLKIAPIFPDLPENWKPLLIPLIPSQKV